MADSWGRDYRRLHEMPVSLLGARKDFPGVANETISTQFIANEELRKVAMEWMMEQVFAHFQGEQPAGTPSSG